MEHAASPSLISLGPTANTSAEGSPFRWGLASSIALHALVIAIAMFVQLQTDNEQPFRTIDVALISLPTMSATTSKPAPAVPKKPVIPQPPQKVAPAPTAPPVENTLPPLPTETASERLSESLGGAINSIIVPQKREATVSPTVQQEPTQRSFEDEAPLLGNLQLPTAPPTIARHKRLQPTKLLHTPSPASTRTNPVPEKTQAPTKSLSQPPAHPVTKPRPTLKPAPTIPSLSKIVPFKKPKSRRNPPKTPKASKIEESLKQNLSDIQTPTLTPNVPKISRKRSTTRPEPQSARPQISAPQLAEIPKTQKPKTSIPTQPKMSDTVKKLMEGLKSTTRKPINQTVPRGQTNPSPTTTPTTKSPPSAIDQRIAKLSIPEVAPVESIKQRLQLLEVEAGGNPGSSTAKASAGKNRYLAMVEDRIDRQWVAPPLLASNPVVVLKFHIARSGEISGIHIAESSGHSHYDWAAHRAVQGVNPLPPFPADISDSFFDVKYRFIKD